MNMHISKYLGMYIWYCISVAVCVFFVYMYMCHVLQWVWKTECASVYNILYFIHIECQTNMLSVPFHYKYSIWTCSRWEFGWMVCVKVGVCQTRVDLCSEISVRWTSHVCFLLKTGGVGGYRASFIKEMSSILLP